MGMLEEVLDDIATKCDRLGLLALLMLIKEICREVKLSWFANVSNMKALGGVFIYFFVVVKLYTGFKFPFLNEMKAWFYLFTYAYLLISALKKRLKEEKEKQKEKDTEAETKALKSE